MVYEEHDVETIIDFFERKRVRNNIYLTVFISAILPFPLYFLSTLLNVIRELVDKDFVPGSGNILPIAVASLLPAVFIFISTSRVPLISKIGRYISCFFLGTNLVGGIIVGSIWFKETVNSEMVAAFYYLGLIACLLHCFTWFQCCRRYEPLLKLETKSVPAEKM